MALIYNKTNATGTEKTLILGVRQAFVRPFDVGAWTDIRLGFWCCIVQSAGDNANSTSFETVTIAGAANNCFAFGIKTNNANFQQAASSGRFLGMAIKITDTNSVLTGGAFVDGVQAPYLLGANDTAILAGSEVSGQSVFLNRNAGATTTYCQRFMLRFLVNNRGLSTQTVNIYVDTGQASGGVSSSTADMPGLATALKQMTIGTSASGAITMNDGVNALTLPDAFFIYHPYNNSRLRLHGMSILRYA